MSNHGKIDLCILPLYTGRMKRGSTESKAGDSGSSPSSNSDWQATQYANLIRYKPSGVYYARVRISGKLIRRSLKTQRISVAKLLLSDFEKSERQRAENRSPGVDDRMTFKQAKEVYTQRLDGNPSLKPRTKDYHKQQLIALAKSWPDLDGKELRAITKSDCLDWAARFGRSSSGSAFNHTMSLLRHVIEVGIENGVRYDNPARFIKRVPERPKKLVLPEPEQFERFVHEIETGGSGWSHPCADLVRFLAFGGFRISEAKFIEWKDCDFRRGVIKVWGDPETRTKNGEFREVPMIPEMRALLERLAKEHSELPLEGPVMVVNECQRAMDRAAAETKMSRVTHHDLRHLFATRCIESGMDIPTVSRWLGHKDGGALAMRVYGHLRDQHSVAMAQKVHFSTGKPTH